MQTSKSFFSERSTIHLAFTPDRLESLMRQGKLHATDFNCLDNKSKRTVWGVLLSVAAHKLR